MSETAKRAAAAGATRTARGRSHPKLAGLKLVSSRCAHATRSGRSPASRSSLPLFLRSARRAALSTARPTLTEGNCGFRSKVSFLLSSERRPRATGPASRISAISLNVLQSRRDVSESRSSRSSVKRARIEIARWCLRTSADRRPKDTVNSRPITFRAELSAGCSSSFDLFRLESLLRVCRFKSAIHLTATFGPDCCLVARMRFVEARPRVSCRT